MATRAVAATQNDPHSEITLYVWEGITEADTGAAIIAGHFDALTVQVIGDFDASGAITVQGSNDGTNWATLHASDDGADVVLTAATMIFSIAERPLWLRPAATAGTSVDMDVYLIAQKLRG